VDDDPGELDWCSYPANVSRNIGLNQTAGSGKVQSNSLAMSVFIA
jgi:hypothetical protein